MKRKSILIGASPVSNPALGVYADMNAWDSFLKSAAGGAWTAEEIVNATNWGREKICGAIESMADADYTLVVFAGHSESANTGLPWKELRLQLGSDEEMLERELNPGNPRSTIIFDSCRTPEESVMESFSVKKADFQESKEVLVACREAYNRAVLKAEGGVVKIFSTEDGVGAEDEDSFSQHLILAATEWTKHYTGVLPLHEAVELGAKSLAVLVPQQKPEYQGGRRKHHFPFAISL